MILQRMDQHEFLRLRTASYRAKKVLPPAIAELVSREIMMWHEFGYRLGDSSIVRRAVDELMKMRETAVERPPTESAVGY